MDGDCRRLENALAKNEPMPLSDELAKHLGECAACSTLLTRRQSTTAALRRAMANDEDAPAALRARIRRELHPGQTMAQTLWQRLRAWFEELNHSWMLATATASLLLVAASATVAYRKAPAPASDLARVNYEQPTGEHNAHLLKIGFGNHLHCAVESDYSSVPLSFAQMAEAMGDEWIDLVPLVTANVPADYRVMIAHHCQFEGRQFIHLTLSNQQTLLSLLLTRKHGEALEAFDAQRAIAQIAGTSLHQMRERNYSVAGFETAAYLGYVVSGLDERQNLQLAFRLVPAVREFVARRES
jgi:hypothetical protein